MIDTIIFDFFGTLVDYSHSRRVQNYSTSHSFLEANGASIAYEQYVLSWDEAFCTLENESQKTLIEFSLHDVVDRFSDRNADMPMAKEQKSEFIELFLIEWCAEIRPIENLETALNKLSSGYKLGVVSNTHHKPLVPGLLEKFGLSKYFETVVTSIEHGRPKPHESIYKAALSRLESRPENSVFVGDSYEHDYVAPRRLGLESFLISQSPPANIPKEHVLSQATEVLDYVL